MRLSDRASRARAGILLACGYAFSCAEARTDGPKEASFQPARDPLEPFRPLRVFTLAYPTSWLTEQVGGDDVQVVDVRPDHDDPEVWAPSPEIIFTIQEEDPVVLIGAGFERWFRAESFSPHLVHRLAEPLGPSLIEAGSGERDPFFWLEPESLDLAARGLADHLIRQRPSARARFRARQADLSERLVGLERRLRARSQGLPPLFAARRGYAYAARSFGWDLELLAIDPVAPPSPEEVAHWRARRAAHPAPVVLFAREPGSDVRSALESVGLSPVVFELMTSRSADDRRAGLGYLEILERSVGHLVDAVEAKPRAR